MIEKNLLKICDFGLTRNIPNHDYYRKITSVGGMGFLGGFSGFLLEVFWGLLVEGGWGF